MSDSGEPQSGVAETTSSVGNGTENQQQPQRQQTTWEIVSGVIFRMAIMYMVMSWFRGGGKQPDNKTSNTGSTTMLQAGNMFQYGDMMDMWVFINEQEKFTEFNNAEKLFWHHTDIEYGQWYDGPNKDGSYLSTGNLKISKRVQNNGSFYMHIYFTKNGFVPDKSLGEDYNEKYTIYMSKRLNKFKKRTIKKTQNLLTGKTETDPELLKHAETHGAVQILSHYHPNITINLVADQTPWTYGKVPAPLDKLVTFDPATHLTYQPIVYINDYWNLLRDYQPLNETVKEINLQVTFQPISLFKLQMYASQGMRNQWFSSLGESYTDESEEDQDTMKEAMVETNPYLLGLTVIVSLVHSVFEFLAFKNDIQFWKSRKSLEGLSVRSVLFGIFQSVVVLLYVLDNDTNFVVRISIFIGCLIDLWKITKVITINVNHEEKIFGVIPKLKFTDKSTYVASSTKKYDELAFKYLGMALFPLLACYAVYSLLYDEHKGFYSYVLGMLYGFLLTFGFIMMTPQLFINYKLKSVAHLPWRMLTYKALNTFIDDIFAFVIKMPTMYRIGCFRDDIVFFIYLYQRYIYRVDPKRVNEFGTSGEDQTSSTDGNLEITESDKKND